MIKAPLAEQPEGALLEAGVGWHFEEYKDWWQAGKTINPDEQMG